MAGVQNIILIDDDPVFNFLHSQIFETTKLDFLIQSFDKAKEALAALTEMAKSARTVYGCIIFVDINMPVMDGWEFLDYFSELPASFRKECTVFMLSSSNNISDIQKAKTFPVVNGYISKPLTVQQAFDVSTKDHSSKKFTLLN